MVPAARRVVHTVGVPSPELPITRHHILPDRTIPSSRTSCRSVAKPAIWMPCERMLTPLPAESACWDLLRAILVTIRGMVLHRATTVRRVIIRIRTNPCISKRWTLIPIRNHRHPCMT